jgi:hypothetical protein
LFVEPEQSLVNTKTNQITISITQKVAKLRAELSGEVEALKAEFGDLKAALRRQMDVTAALAADAADLDGGDYTGSGGVIGSVGGSSFDFANSGGAAAGAAAAAASKPASPSPQQP